MCPECRGRLEQESYVFAVRKRGDIHPFVTGNDGDYFCSRCFEAVLDHSRFSDFVSLGMGNDIPGSEFAVLGLGDLDAISEDKKHLSLSRRRMLESRIT